MHFEELIKTIKERREIMQVTQETLAELSGVGLRTLKQFESGQFGQRAISCPSVQISTEF